MWGFRMVIPSKLRNLILEELHTSHSGISKTKSLARLYVWWPKMDKSIEQMISSCFACGSVRASPPKAVNCPWPTPENPWERIHADFLGPFLNNHFLIIEDAHSKWVEVYIIKHLTSTETIEKFYDVFSRFGLPKTLETDNGTQFTSAEFQLFLQRNGINHLTSPPWHPQSNGLAENAVKSFKSGMTKILTNKLSSISLNIAISKYLLSQRTTNHCTTGQPPSVLMLGR